MKTQFYECNPGAASTAVDTASAKTDFLALLANKYNDPSQWDKLTEAQQKVDQVKAQLQTNLKKITNNRDQMMVLFLHILL